MLLVSEDAHGSIPHRLGSLWSFLVTELKPYPGRWRTALKMTAAAVLALCCSLAYQQAELLYGVLVAFFCVQDDWVKSVKIALGVPFLALIGLAYSLFVLSVFGFNPVVRFVAIVVVSFVSLFLVQAASAGQAWVLVGVLGESFLRSWDTAGPAEAHVEGSLLVILTLLSGGLAGTIISVLFAPGDRWGDLRCELATRFELAQTVVGQWPECATPETCKQILAQSATGADPMLEMLRAAEHKVPELLERHEEYVATIGIAVMLLDQLTALQASYGQQDEMPTEPASVLARGFGAAAQAFRAGTAPTSFPAFQNDCWEGTPLEPLSSTLGLLYGVFAGSAHLLHEIEDREKQPFLRPDAFTNPVYRNNAVKATAAAILCYIIMTASNYPGLGTSITTCFITALTTVGQSRQKQSLRILGNVSGALFGLFAITWIVPKLNDIAGLSVLVAIGSFVAAWVLRSSSRLSYAGIQFLLCFYLVVLSGSSVNTSLIPARDRVIGVLLGVTVMWLVYDQIKPEWTHHAARVPLIEALESTARMAALRVVRGSTEEHVRNISRERKHFNQGLESLGSMLEVQRFELNLATEHESESCRNYNVWSISCSRCFPYKCRKSSRNLQASSQTSHNLAPATES